MNIIFFAHPAFLKSQSMPRFVRMLDNGMRARGWSTRILTPTPHLYKMPLPMVLRKWLGYIDQFIIFPLQAKRQLKALPPDTIIVFTDHALGPWVPLARHLPHVIHCHDFLAQQSAQGKHKANPLQWTGVKYQEMIYKGYSMGKNFICVSNKTQADLHTFIPSENVRSEVVYNPLNPVFFPRDKAESRRIFQERIGVNLSKGYVLHVGGNQWYKNRSGVLEIYNTACMIQPMSIPLILVGQKPDANLIDAFNHSPFRNNIHFVTDLEDDLLPFAYAGATVFLFPSLAEGFGWPIAEAMASGCPVITTGKAPMTEVAGSAAYTIPVRPTDPFEVSSWATKSAKGLIRILDLSEEERNEMISEGIHNIRRFVAADALNRIDNIYREILEAERVQTLEPV